MLPLGEFHKVPSSTCAINRICIKKTIFKTDTFVNEDAPSLPIGDSNLDEFLAKGNDSPRKASIVSEIFNLVSVVYLAVLSGSCLCFGTRTGHIYGNYVASNWDEMEDPPAWASLLKDYAEGFLADHSRGSKGL